VGSDEELARVTVEALLHKAPEFDDYSVLESAEVIWLEDQPGVSITWTQTTSDQGVRKFGLIMTVAEMRSSLHGSDMPSDFDGWMLDLRLAVEEPHGTSATEGVRTWFRRWP
jgi:hypothetical protein